MTDEQFKIFSDKIDRALTSKPKRFAGFQIQEWVLLATFLFGAGLNWGSFIELKKSNIWLLDFARRSDQYHGSVTGEIFYQGAPQNPAFDPKIMRARITGDVVARAKGEA